MPIYWLTEELVFPPPEGASPEGLVAVGGDASPERLVLAYSQGIFPWPAEKMPLLWFSPDPRFVLIPQDIHVPRSLRKQIHRGLYDVQMDTAFAEVITRCADVSRPHQQGTWITDELIEGYLKLHQLGYAHSVEAWKDGMLVGGIYGVSLGKAFFGESMFADSPDASKIAFVTLAGHLIEWGFDFVDCQVWTAHLERFGAIRWSRHHYLQALRNAVDAPTRRGPWQSNMTPTESLAYAMKQKSR